MTNTYIIKSAPMAQWAGAKSQESKSHGFKSHSCHLVQAYGHRYVQVRPVRFKINHFKKRYCNKKVYRNVPWRNYSVCLWAIRRTIIPWLVFLQAVDSRFSISHQSRMFIMVQLVVFNFLIIIHIRSCSVKQLLRYLVIKETWKHFRLQKYDTIQCFLSWSADALNWTSNF